MAEAGRQQSSPAVSVELHIHVPAGACERIVVVDSVGNVAGNSGDQRGRVVGSVEYINVVDVIACAIATPPCRARSRAVLQVHRRHVKVDLRPCRPSYPHPTVLVVRIPVCGPLRVQAVALAGGAIDDGGGVIMQNAVQGFQDGRVREANILPILDKIPVGKPPAQSQ